MITLKYLKDKFQEAIKADYQIISETVEIMIILLKNKRKWKLFSFCPDSGQFLLDFDKPVWARKFKEEYKEVWDKIYEYYFGTEEKQIGILFCYPTMLEHIDEISERIQLELVKVTPWAIGDIFKYRVPYSSAIELHEKLWSDYQNCV